MSLLSLVCACLLLLLLKPHPFSHALNLDPLSPTIVPSGLSSADSAFGWTLTQHTFNDGRKGVLVSAPKAAGNNSMEEGGVYSCPFDVSGSCQFEPLFQRRRVFKDNPFIADLSDNPLSYEGQLMGYSLKSSGNVVMACAPLYVGTFTRQPYEDEFYFPGTANGRCIILDSDLSNTTQVYSGNIPNLRLAGLDNEIVDVNGNQGFILPSTFSGGIRSPYGGQLVLSNSVVRNLINADQSTDAPQVPVDILHGYHLETGAFTRLSPAQIVVSSPRAIDHFGQIEILNIDNLGAGSMLTLRGDEADGYYGYDFAVLDLDHQGYSSLAVGCPLCARERGRVYVYAHTGDPSAALVESVIEAPSREAGRFGLAVENIGDLDRDGFSDIAVSAPYEEMGVVYIYRGSERGMVVEEFQTLKAVAGTVGFGYSLSGGLDIDNNGYPDLTVGDRGGGRVTTIRGSPLVNVTLLVPDRKNILNITGGSDRLCPLGGVFLHCFTITPCFFYEEQQLDSVPRIALSYNLVVDEGGSRVFSYSMEGGVVTTGEAKDSGNVTISGPGKDNMACGETVTFALSASFVETNSIPVRLTVDDAPELETLDPDSGLAQFGEPLHPTIMKYTRGDTRAFLELEYEIESNIDCSTGDPDTCEGMFVLDASDITDNQRILLASSNEFGFSLNVTNVAEDTAVSPLLIIRLPQETRLSRTVPSVTCNSRTVTNSNGSIVECPLKNPMSSGESFITETYFVFGDVSALLTVETLEISFSVKDGGTQEESDLLTRTIGLDAVSEYGLSSRVAQEEYRALRSATVFPNTSALTLAQLGPQVTLMVRAGNSRDSSTGTTFPRSTLYIHLPREILVEGEGQEGVATRRPLLIPFRILVGSNVNCSHYEAIPDGLPPAQQPMDFVPPWTGPAPPTNPECTRNGTLQCGTIICTIFDLQPLPVQPAIITLFARLYSPSIGEERERVRILSEISSDTDLPRLGDNSINFSSDTFVLAPGVREVQRDCIRYWVVVVSVVIGIFALVVLVILLAVCGLFRRWYKYRRDEADGVENTDNELSYEHPRTIPPIRSLTNGVPASPPPEEDWKNFAANISEKEREKEAEAQAELEEDLRIMGQPPAPVVDMNFDPSSVLDDNDFEGLETDL